MLKKAGCVAGLCTFHVKPRERGGWHYHMHLIGEFDGSVEREKLREVLHLQWYKARGCTGEEPLLWGRQVAEAGEAMVELTGDGQMDFWREAEGPVERVLQYCLRDVLQGVETWVEKIRGAMNAADLCATLSSVKLRRLFGKWRAKTEEEAQEKQKGAEIDGATGTPNKEREEVAKGTGTWLDVGTMDDVLRRAASGEKCAKEDLAALLGSFGNRGRVASRLSSWATAIAA